MRDINYCCFIIIKNIICESWRTLERLGTIISVNLYCFSSDGLWTHFGFRKWAFCRQPSEQPKNHHSMTEDVACGQEHLQPASHFQMICARWSNFLLEIIYIIWHSLDNNFAWYVACVCLSLSVVLCLKPHEPVHRTEICAVQTHCIIIKQGYKCNIQNI